MKKFLFLFLANLVVVSVSAQELNIKNDTCSNNSKSSILLRCNINQIPKLNFPEANFITIYNSSLANFNYYPSILKNNFNLYSPRVANQLNAPIKMDSFNPYATNKPQIALLLGAVDLFLKN